MRIRQQHDVSSRYGCLGSLYAHAARSRRAPGRFRWIFGTPRPVKITLPNSATPPNEKGPKRKEILLLLPQLSPPVSIVAECNGEKGRYCRTISRGGGGGRPHAVSCVPSLRYRSVPCGGLNILHGKKPIQKREPAHARLQKVGTAEPTAFRSRLCRQQADTGAGLFQCHGSRTVDRPLWLVERETSPRLPQSLTTTAVVSDKTMTC
ncbi:hypothetical protein LX36DRAFT_371374 [Colletotrichum falcatum]|nr:hypothetical protein LX36DRAFT_371374 [Colletotrichum falcatum]